MICMDLFHEFVDGMICIICTWKIYMGYTVNSINGMINGNVNVYR